MKFFVVLGALLVRGLAAVVINHGGSDDGAAISAAASSTAPTATLTHGDWIDIDASIPKDGYVIVEFYADW